MDSPETPTKSPQSLLMRCFFLIILCVFVVLSSSVTVVLVAALIGNFSITHPISVPSQCKIVSSTVDIRSSKVCELGLLNYKAKHVFYPSEKKKFRCRYDYYWASVFKVEYIDHSGQAQLASAEAPNEALPPDCRPSFSAAWLTKDEFKVNGTYDCWYTLGLSKVNLNHDGFFNCQASDPSTIEMLRRYSVLCSRMFFAWFASWGKASYWRWDVVAGLVTGFSTSLISISLIRILHVMSIIPRIFSAIMLSFNTARMKRACFLVAYFSLVGWLAIQYCKRLGIAI